MAFDLAIIFGLIGASGILAYLAVEFDERYKPIKLLFLFGSLLSLLFAVNSGIEITKLQDLSVTVNCVDNSSATACTAYDDLVTLNSSAYETLLWIGVAALLFYIIYFIWDLLSAAVNNQRAKKNEQDS